MSIKLELVEADKSAIQALEPELLSSYPDARFYVGGLDAPSGKWRIIRIVGAAQCEAAYCPTLIKHDRTDWKILVKAADNVTNTASIDGGEFVQFDLASSNGRRIAVKYHNGQHIILIAQSEVREQDPASTRCPPDGSRIALFSRQATDQGREQENKEYARYGEELFAISTSSPVASDVLEKSIIATINFSKKMRARGHDIGIVDLVIDREKIISDLLRDQSTAGGIRVAQLNLQLAVAREMKKILCR